MSDNWIVQNLENALETWNEKLAEIWQLITQSPEQFKGGTIWNVIVGIHGAVQAIGLALLVLFFVVAVMLLCGVETAGARPQSVYPLRPCQSRRHIRLRTDDRSVQHRAGADLHHHERRRFWHGAGNRAACRDRDRRRELRLFESIPLWAVTLIGGLFITVLSFIMIMTVYGRFFKLYLYTAIAPVPLSTFAGEPSQNIGKSFIKSYAAVCLEGAIIVLACIIFSLFASSPPVVDPDAAAVTQVWSYVGELVFNMLVLVGAVKMADRVVREMMGL